SVICVVQEAGNVALEQRCAGVKSTLGGAVTNLQVDNNNLPGAQSLIQAKLATFDLNADVAKAVQDGKILFAVDQQPYLQGYIAVVMLTQYKANLNVLGGGLPVLTGPNLITKDNAAAVL